MEMKSVIGIPEGKLTAIVTRANGTKEYLGELKPTFWQKARLWLKQVSRLWRRRSVLATLLLFVLIAFGGVFALPGVCFGLVTTAGVNYMAADFRSGGVTPTISGFKFHDAGTGTTAAAIGDTALQTPWGGARVSGTPGGSTNVYQTVATINFTGTFAITEWGLFSAATTGTLWDHRVFAAINVNNGDSIQFTYALTVPAGGS